MSDSLCGGSIIIIFMVLSSWQSHCKSSPGSFDECSTVPNGCRLSNHHNDLGSVSANRPLKSTTTIPIYYYYYSARKLIFILPATNNRRLSGEQWLVYILSIHPQTVAHSGSNQARCIATTLIETNALPLSQIATVNRNIMCTCIRPYHVRL